MREEEKLLKKEAAREAALKAGIAATQVCMSRYPCASMCVCLSVCVCVE